MKEKTAMKKAAALLALAGLGFAAAPSHAQAPNLVYIPTTINANFSTTLTAFDGGPDDYVDILALDNGVAPGQTYAAGQFGFDGAEFQVLNLTQDSLSFPGEYDITPQMAFNTLLLTENFSDGSHQSLNLYDLADPTTPTTSSDPFDLASDGVTPLTGDLQTNPVIIPHAGPSLVSATLTGQFSDNFTPGTSIPVRIAVVPEAGTDALLLLGLLPAALLGLRARRSIRHSGRQ
ncbi:MAG: hypothetical protein JO250_20995 [Armatimonadetes bacterium]|nr:hypothetical protein [Armatimonadota bacterium]